MYVSERKVEGFELEAESCPLGPKQPK